MPTKPAHADQNLDASIAQVRQWIAESERIAVLTGAGVSAESGVPTFRDAQTGFWAQFSPEEMASRAGYEANPQRVWDWYLYRRQLIGAVAPNAGHVALAQWQQQHPGQLTLVTQNVDGLHQRAGSSGVLCLHGNLMEDRWLHPPRPCCDLQQTDGGAPPQCPSCGNCLRPAVVWFGENLPHAVFAQAQDAAEACGVMLVVGTSGRVYPAAGLAHLAKRTQARVVIINTEPSDLDDVADVLLRGPAAVLLPLLLGAPANEALQAAN